MSAGTAAYAVYALARPRHLGAALSADQQRQRSFDTVATTFGLRDLPISMIGLLGRSPHAVRTAMLLRIVLDVADGAFLARQAQNRDRAKRVGIVTLGWASLNTIAVTTDSRRTSRNVRDRDGSH